MSDKAELEKEEALMQYATHIFEAYVVEKGTNINYTTIERLPIAEIDGMAAYANIYITPARVFIEIKHLNINGCCVPDTLYRKDHMTTTNPTVEDVYNALEDFTKVVDNLKLDKIRGKLSDTPQFYPFECKFLKSPNIKSKYQECCVCYDITQTETICKHPLCVRCWGQIPMVNPDGDDDYEQSCPICRRDLQNCGNNH